MGFWRRAKFSALCAAVLCHGLVVASPASAEVFDMITTPGDGWDVAFHPTNQNYGFFVNHRTDTLGCFYRLDPDGAGNGIAQGDGCFGEADYTLALPSIAGNDSSVWVTSDGNTAYVPLNNNGTNSAGDTGIAKVNISDANPNNWLVTGTANWAADMQYYTNSIMVDDVLYTLSATGWLTLDTANNDTASEVAFSGNGPDNASNIYHADGKLWAVSSDWYLHCFDPADGSLCDHPGWTNGKSTDQFTTSTPNPDAVVEYRNTDGSFGGFCIAYTASDWTSPTYACLDADGLLDATMVNPFEKAVDAIGVPTWGNAQWHANWVVSRQHQVIINEPLKIGGQDYFCWDYTTQAACANFNMSQDNSHPGQVYTIVQDPWNDNCFWSNAHDKLIGVWNVSHAGGFATAGGECDITSVAETVTLTYDPQGGSGEPGDQSGDAASDVTVSTTEPTRAGYTFTGWNTAADGTGTSYSGDDTYTLPNSGTDTLYAQWQINTVGLTYDPQGGSGEPGDQSGDAASDVTVSTTEPTRAGYSFTGWNTAADGTGTSYAGDDTYTLPNSGTDTLYAQWQPVTTTTTTAPPTTTTAPPTTTTAPPTTTTAPPTTTTAPPTTTTAPPVVAPPTAGPADPVTGSPTFTG
jgi:uncharacterized repeat protein (TIGR02543 family)